jgi:hypothetical protein
MQPLLEIRTTGASDGLEITFQQRYLDFRSHDFLQDFQ